MEVTKTKKGENEEQPLLQMQNSLFTDSEWAQVCVLRAWKKAEQ